MIAGDRRSSPDVINRSCTLYNARCSVIKFNAMRSSALFKSAGLIPTVCVVAIMLVSCASESQTTAKHQTTSTTQSQTNLPSQPIGYRDNNMETGGPGLKR
jgi:hypothetical protein